MVVVVDGWAGRSGLWLSGVSVVLVIRLGRYIVDGLTVDGAVTASCGAFFCQQ